MNKIVTLLLLASCSASGMDNSQKQTHAKLRNEVTEIFKYRIVYAMQLDNKSFALSAVTDYEVHKELINHLKNGYSDAHGYQLTNASRMIKNLRSNADISPFAISTALNFIISPHNRERTWDDATLYAAFKDAKIE